jgi:hypothetical protein
MINLVETERRRAEDEEYAKIKTEQMCMEDNKRSMKKTGISPSKVTDQSTSYREHPFSKLTDEQENSRKQTKLNFLYQNQLNNIQTKVDFSQLR